MLTRHLLLCTFFPNDSTKCASALTLVVPWGIYPRVGRTRGSLPTIRSIAVGDDSGCTDDFWLDVFHLFITLMNKIGISLRSNSRRSRGTVGGFIYNLSGGKNRGSTFRGIPRSGGIILRNSVLEGIPAKGIFVLHRISFYYNSYFRRISVPNCRQKSCRNIPPRILRNTGCHLPKFRGT